MANATSASTGSFDPQIPGLPLGGCSSGIGLGPLVSGPDPYNNFTVDSANDYALQFVGGNVLGSIVVEPTTFVAGSGYTPDGPYEIQSTGGGAPNGAASIVITVTGGAITWARVKRPGSGFSSAPTFTVANAVNMLTGVAISGGSGGTVTAVIGTSAKPTSMITPSANKPFRRVVAAGAVANGAAVTPGTYLNQSGRALVAGDEVWAVAP